MNSRQIGATNRAPSQPELQSETLFPTQKDQKKNKCSDGVGKTEVLHTVGADVKQHSHLGSQHRDASRNKKTQRRSLVVPTLPYVSEGITVSSQ